MKILLATYWPLPHLGGVWPFMEQIKRKMEAMGHTVDIMGNGAAEPCYHIVGTDRRISKEKLLPIVRAKLAPQLYPSLNEDSLVQHVETDRYCMELAAAYFGVGQYDVIHAQDVISALAMNRVRHRHTALVSSIHGSLAREVKLALAKQHPQLNLNDSLVWKYYYAIERLGTMAGEVTITSSQWLKRIMMEHFAVPEQQLTVFQYGLDTGTFFTRKAQGTDLHKPPGKKLIICPARLVYIKGIHHLLDALALLKQVRSDWECWIVGDGDKREELEQQAVTLGLYHDIKFLGNRKDVPALLTLADIFAHPSIQDNQPFSLMEAQVSGKPSVVSDAGGLPEIVEHGVTGFVSPVGDIYSLFRHLKQLVENDVLRHNMSVQAQAWGLRHWSLETMIQRTLTTYEAAATLNMAKRSGYHV